MLIVFELFCYCHSVIKSRATCRMKRRCQSDQSTVSVLANRSLHQDLMHNGYRGTAGPNVCLQAFSLFPLPTPLNQRPVHRLHKVRLPEQKDTLFKMLKLIVKFLSCLRLKTLKTIARSNSVAHNSYCFGQINTV